MSAGTNPDTADVTSPRDIRFKTRTHEFLTGSVGGELTSSAVRGILVSNSNEMGPRTAEVTDAQRDSFLQGYSWTFLMFGMIVGLHIIGALGSNRVIAILFGLAAIAIQLIWLYYLITTIGTAQESEVDRDNAIAYAWGIWTASMFIWVITSLICWAFNFTDPKFIEELTKGLDIVQKIRSILMMFSMILFVISWFFSDFSDDIIALYLATPLISYTFAIIVVGILGLKSEDSKSQLSNIKQAGMIMFFLSLLFIVVLPFINVSG